MFKQEDVLGDLHVHSTASKHACNTVQEILDHTSIPYIAITDHVQDFNNFYENCNIAAFIHDLHGNYKFSKRIIGGAEMDFNVDNEKACFNPKQVIFRIMSFHANGLIDKDAFIRIIDETEPTVIAHPFRYVNKLPGFDKNSKKYMDDMKEVIEYAVSKGAMIELNEKSLSTLPIDFIKSLKCSFSMGSDSHELHTIGLFPNAIDFLNTYLPAADVINFDRSRLQALVEEPPRVPNVNDLIPWGLKHEAYKAKFETV